MDKKTIKTITFCTFGAILFVFLLWNFEIPAQFIKTLFTVLRPLIIGGAIAFVLNRPMERLRGLYKKIFNKKNALTKKGKEKTYRISTIATVYVIFILLLVGIVLFIIPQIGESITFFVNSFDVYAANFTAFIDKTFGNVDFSWLEEYNIMEKIYTALSDLAEKIPQFITAAFGVTANIISSIVDVFVGLVFSIYILGGKKKLKSQVSRMFHAIFSDKMFNRILRYYKLTSNTFSHFINGQLTEACILGILCFIGMSIFGFEYSVLISFIIGITNVIPIFGPILGTIPCALILLFVHPINAVWFVIFIIILQQIEANIIYPRVVGNSVGLSSMWTLMAIVIGGGLFGIGGMVFAVPVMSIAYIVIGDLVKKKLAKKALMAANTAKTE
ncbi:MAG: AI-2E family transporter [Oscillospiraceae bacterium]